MALMSRNDSWMVIPQAIIKRIAPSGKAILVQKEDVQDWLPLSQVMDGDYGEGEIVDIVVKEWVLGDKEIAIHAEPYEGEAYDEQHR